MSQSGQPQLGKGPLTPIKPNLESAGVGDLNAQSPTANSPPADGKPVSSYKKPSIKKARRVRLLLHPSYVPENEQEEARRFYDCCATKTGRFCPSRCAKCDPFCESNTSDFQSFGSGTTGYFKTLKFYVVMFFLLTLTALPSLAINGLGVAAATGQSTFSLTRTTIGNLADLKSDEVAIPLLGGTMRKRDVALLYSLCDLLGCLILAWAFVWLRFFSAKEEQKVDSEMVTADDYTIYLPSVPADITEDELREFFINLTKTPSTPHGMAVADINIIETNVTLVAIFTQRGRIVRKMERLKQRIALMHDRLTDGHKHATGSCGRVSLAKRIQQLQAKKTQLQLQLEKLELKIREQTALNPAGSACAAFITFENGQATDFVLNLYPDTWANQCFQADIFKLKGKPLRVLRAPPPSSIIWHNLRVSATSRMLRQSFTGILTALLLVASFLLLFFASVAQQSVGGAANAAMCKDDDVVAAISSGAVNATTVLGKSDTEATVFCYCSTLPWQTFTVRDMLEQGTLGTTCITHACSRYFALAPEFTFQLDYCVEWVGKSTTAVVLTVIASMGVLVINTVLGYFMRLLTAYEGHPSFDTLNTSLALRLFFAQFFNTVLLMILINVDSSSFVGSKWGTGKYADFTPGWFENVGSQIITTMIIGAITPHVYNTGAALLGSWLRFGRHVRVLTQKDLNERFLGPYADYSLRYAQIYNVFAVCFVFSTGMPILLPIACVSILVSYLMDKAFFIHYYRTPPVFGMQLAKAISNIVPLALVLHAGIGLWMLSSESIFNHNTVSSDVLQYAGMSTQMVEAVATDGIVSRGIKRVSSQQAVPLLLLLLCMVVAQILRMLYSSCGKLGRNMVNACTCNKLKDVLEFVWATDADGFVPLYSEAVDPANVGETWAMRGLKTYNMLESPEIQAAFGITSTFAANHKRLSEVLDFNTKVKSNRNLMDGAGADAGADKTGSTARARRLSTKTSEYKTAAGSTDALEDELEIELDETATFAGVAPMATTATAAAAARRLRNLPPALVAPNESDSESEDEERRRAPAAATATATASATASATAPGPRRASASGVNVQVA